MWFTFTITYQMHNCCDHPTYSRIVQSQDIVFCLLMFGAVLSKFWITSCRLGRRWQPRSWKSIFMGFNNLHSSKVPLILNLQTEIITPHYHVVFDDFFSKVLSSEIDIELPAHLLELSLYYSIHIPTDSLE
jgi:hypothetical protein